MASYHCNLSRVSKNKGHSAQAKFEYISRAGDYKKRTGLQYAESLNMPNFAQEKPELFWESADIYERANSNVAFELKIALPRELNLEQQKNLMRDFIKKELPNAPATFAIHNDEENHNPHCHLMFSSRMMNARTMKLSPDKFFKRASKNKEGRDVGGALKDESMNEKKKLYSYRESVAEITNQHLSENGFDSRVEHRSFRNMGIYDLEPAPRIPLNDYINLKRKIAKEKRTEQWDLKQIESEMLNLKKEIEIEEQRELERKREEEQRELERKQAEEQNPYIDKALSERFLSIAHVFETGLINSEQEKQIVIELRDHLKPVDDWLDRKYNSNKFSEIAKNKISKVLGSKNVIDPNEPDEKCRESLKKSDTFQEVNGKYRRNHTDSILMNNGRDVFNLFAQLKPVRLIEHLRNRLTEIFDKFWDEVNENLYRGSPEDYRKEQEALKAKQQEPQQEPQQAPQQAPQPRRLR